MTKQTFWRNGEKLCATELHYTDCGLSNIYLLNGFSTETVDGEEYLTVKDIDGLHRAIGLQIVLDKKAPSGEEIRFLRNEMRISQSDLAAKIGVSSQSVARWEKGLTDPGAAVFAIKVIYVLSLIPDHEQQEVLRNFMKALDQLMGSDETSERILLSYDGHEWKDAA